MQGGRFWNKKFVLKNIKWIVVLIFFLVLSTEITLRIACKQKLCKWESIKFEADPMLGYRYMPNIRNTFRNSAFTHQYTTNSLGFPGYDFSYSKKPDYFRIMVVGTSDDTGFYTDGPSGYVELLNDLFKKSKSNIEVINMSMEGKYRSLINMKLITDELPKYEPDLILYGQNEFPFSHKANFRTTYKGVCICYTNYNENLDSAKRFIDRYLMHKPFEAHLFDYSYIMRLIYTYYINHRRDHNNMMVQFVKNYLVKNENMMVLHVRNFINNWTITKEKGEMHHENPEIIYSEKESLDMLKQVKTALLRKNIGFMLFDTYFRPEDEKLAELFKQNGLRFLPLNIPTQKEYDFGKVEGHSTLIGHKKIAGELYKVLTDNIIPKEYLNFNFKTKQ